jgi:hypothetical protein
MNLQKLNLGFSSRNILQLKVLALIAATFGQLPVTESVVLPLFTGKLAMQAKSVSDEVDAHRLLVDVESGRSTANYINNQKIFTQGEPADEFFRSERSGRPYRHVRERLAKNDRHSEAGAFLW